MRVWAEPIKSFYYYLLSVANSKAVCLLEFVWKTGNSLKKVKNVPSLCSNDGINYKNNFFFLLLQFTALAVMFSRQMSHLAIKKVCDSIKFCGRCPHPQPLKRLTKLFCFGTETLAFSSHCCPIEKAKHNHLQSINKVPVNLFRFYDKCWGNDDILKISTNKTGLSQMSKICNSPYFLID